MGAGGRRRFPDLTFEGEPIDDQAELKGLPETLVDILREVNGFIAFRGGLHVRGVASSPPWHSLIRACQGEDAFHWHYRSLAKTDVLFAEDAMGDQFLLRNGEVWKLAAEIDEVDLVSPSLDDFFASCEEDPVDFLALHPLLQLERDGYRLQPGELVNAYPPFCTLQSGEGRVSLRAVPTEEQHYFLRRVSATIRDLPEGASVEFKIIE